MTPKEYKKAVSDLAASIGLRAVIYTSLDSDYGDFKKDCIFEAAIYPRGIGSAERCALRVAAADLDELFEKLTAGWAECSARYRAETVRKMALRIINLTAENGECTDAALRGDVFSAGDVKMFGAEACEEANRIAAKGPFSIVSIKGANAA
jgi:hypothetical protein